MGILKDIESAAADIEKAIKKADAVIINDLEKVEKDISDGMAKIKSYLAKGFDEAEQKIINSLKADALAKYAAEIQALQTLATQGISSADINAIMNDIKSVVTSADAGAASAILSNLVTTPMQQAYQNFTAFDTLTIGLDGEIDLLIGVSAGASGGIEITKAGDVDKARILVDFLGSAGADEGGDVGLCIGIWKGKPKDMTGGFISVTLDADEGVGLGIVLYFTVSTSPSFSGIILNINSGEEIEASIDCGFTVALGVPKGSVINMPVGG